MRGFELQKEQTEGELSFGEAEGRLTGVCGGPAEGAGGLGQVSGFGVDRRDLKIFVRYRWQDLVADYIRGMRETEGSREGSQVLGLR